MLPRPCRITQNKDWDRLHRFGRTFYSPDAILKVLYNRSDEPTHFGLIVGTKVSKKAVVRNRIKRQLRASISRIKPRIKNGYEVALITKASISKRSFTELREMVTQLFTQAKLFE